MKQEVRDLKIAIVEDNINDQAMLLYHLNQQIQKHPLIDEATEINCFNSAQSFLEAFKAQNFDMICIEILLQGENGIELARQIREQNKDVFISFVSSSNAYASESFQVHANYYLLKPVTDATANKLVEQFVRVRPQKEDMIVLHDNFTFRAKDLAYSSYHNHKVTLHFRNGKEKFVFSRQADMEAILLKNDMFCKINRGTIINLSQIEQINRPYLFLNNGQRFSISRSLFSSVKKEYNQYQVSMN